MPHATVPRQAVLTPLATRDAKAASSQCTPGRPRRVRPQPRVRCPVATQRPSVRCAIATQQPQDGGATLDSWRVRCAKTPSLPKLSRKQVARCMRRCALRNNLARRVPVPGPVGYHGWLKSAANPARERPGGSLPRGVKLARDCTSVRAAPGTRSRVQRPSGLGYVMARFLAPLGRCGLLQD